MQTLVSLIPEPYFSQVQKVQLDLQTRFALRPPLSPLPHLTWHMVANYRQPEMLSIVDSISRTITPFEISLGPCSFFDQDEPVLYLSLTSAFDLQALQQRICTGLRSLSHELSPFTRPGSWTPHITLAKEGLTRTLLPDALSFIQSQDLAFSFTIDSFTLLIPKPGLSESEAIPFRFGRGLFTEA